MTPSENLLEAGGAKEKLLGQKQDRSGNMERPKHVSDIHESKSSQWDEKLATWYSEYSEDRLVLHEK